MANYNRVILVGNLTRDPELSILPSQTPVVEFGLAMNRRWRGQDGQQREETCFIDCRAYGRQGQTIIQYLAKVRQALVEGRLQFDRWVGQDGQRRSKHRVIVDRCQFLDPAPSGGRGAAAPYPRQAQAPAQAPAPSQQPAPAPTPQDPPRDDIPRDDPPPPSSYEENNLGGGEDIPF